MSDDFQIDVTLSSPLAPKTGSLVGLTLGGFRLTRLLGTGGMGAVYLGEHTVIGSRVAVKVLHPELSANQAQVDRFHAEARAVNLIDQENIVRIFDLSRDPEGRHYFVMEYLEGRPLSAFATQAMSAREAIPILNQVLGALGAAHARGVVHRDLKPDNIFLIRRGENDRFVKVLDFGVAKLLAGNAGANQTQAGMAIGTPTYMSPEQWTGKSIDGRADLYSLGIIAYLLSTGRLPFPRGGLMELLAYHKEKIPDAPHLVNPSVPRAWSDAIMKALAKRPEDRFVNASEMALAFGKVLNELNPAPSFMPTPPPIAPVSVNEIASKATPLPARYATPAPVGGLTTPAPAERRATRFAVHLPARILDASGQELFDAICTDLSRGGLYVCHTGKPPALFAALKIVLVVEGRVLDCPGEVVRHVSVEDAARWKMSPGFAVQFSKPTAELRDAIKGVLAAFAEAHPGMAIAARLEKVNPTELYGVLAAPPDSTCEDLLGRAAELTDLLVGAEKDAQSETARKQLGDAKLKVQGARVILCDPRRRVDHDVARRNVAGVRRCLQAGLTLEELQQVHDRFARSNPEAVNGAKLHFISGTVWEKRADLEQAKNQYLAALRMDPANPALHQALTGLERASGTSAGGTPSSRKTAPGF